MTTAVADETKYIQRGIPVSNGKLAMWLFLVTEIMFFTGLIGTYIVLRLGTPGRGLAETLRCASQRSLGRHQHVCPDFFKLYGRDGPLGYCPR
jgi:heme/copper-type cytochrome/quinol oxidase subunit 3